MFEFEGRTKLKLMLSGPCFYVNHWDPDLLIQGGRNSFVPDSLWTWVSQFTGISC